jgi:hypothetical protein
MPQTLINEFIDRRKAGEPLPSSLKNAIFQATSVTSDFSYDEEEAGNKFQLWKVNMRGLIDDEPMYVCCFLLNI